MTTLHRAEPQTLPMDEWDERAAELLRWLENADETWHERFQAVAAAALRQAAAKGREDPTTIAGLQAEIGRLQAKLYWLVCGDPRKSSGLEFTQSASTEDEPTS